MPKILFDVASVLRSKNSGPFLVTLDVLFNEERNYLAIKESGIINKKEISRLYKVREENILDIIYFDNAQGIKITIERKDSSGSFEDRDVYGAQQHAPLMNLDISGVMM